MPYLPRLYDDEQTGAWVTHVVLPQCRVWVAHDPTDPQILGFAAVEGDMPEHLYLLRSIDGAASGRSCSSRRTWPARAGSPCGSSPVTPTRGPSTSGAVSALYFRPLDGDDGSRNEENEPDMTYGWAESR